MLDYWRSSIGKKQVVAVTGAILVLYLILHMVGNLNSLYGPGGSGEPRVDWYAHWLREFGQPILPYEFVLWAVRGILLVSLILHVTGIAQLTARNRAARPAGHPAPRIGRSIESGLMLLSGVLILAFIVFHILQFTTLTIDVTPLHEGTVYANLYYAFQEWYFVVIYIAAVLLIGVHLRHGIWSVVQTLGLDNPGRNPRIRAGALTLTVLIVVGFILVPVLFATGTLGIPDSAAVLSAGSLIPGGIS